MSAPIWKREIRSDLRPAYFDDFRCLAQNCRFSCCKGWAVTFDKDDYFKLRQHGRIPRLSEGIAAGLSRLSSDTFKETGYYGELRMRGGRCPLLSEEGLCRLQLNSDEEALPNVCRTFPRKEKLTLTGYLERSLTLGCEGVLYLLWDLQDGIGFVSDALPEKDCKFISNEKEVAPHLDYIHEIRSLCIDLMQDRRFPLHQRILLMGLRLQALIQEKEEVSAWLTATEGFLNMPETAEIARMLTVSDHRALAMFLGNNISLLDRMARDNKELGFISKAVMDYFHLDISQHVDTVKLNLEDYQNVQEKFNQLYGEAEYFFENLAVALFFYLEMPAGLTLDGWWKSYMNFCTILSFYRFLAVLSTVVQLPPIKGETLVPGSKHAMIHLLTQASRALLHNSHRSSTLREEFFKNDSTSLAHMAILLCG